MPLIGALSDFRAVADYRDVRSFDAANQVLRCLGELESENDSFDTLSPIRIIAADEGLECRLVCLRPNPLEMIGLL
jgi:hypothetical protein